MVGAPDMSPEINVSPKIYKFSYENLRILKDTIGSVSTMDNYSGLRYTSWAFTSGLLRGGEAL